MRNLVLGLALLASTLIGAPGKSHQDAKPPQPQPEVQRCPLTCGVEVTCADGRVFCNCCLAKQAGEKHCSPCNF